MCIFYRHGTTNYVDGHENCILLGLYELCGLDLSILPCGGYVLVVLVLSGWNSIEDGYFHLAASSTVCSVMN